MSAPDLVYIAAAPFMTSSTLRSSGSSSARCSLSSDTSSTMQSSITLPNDRLQIVRLWTSPIGGPPRVVVIILSARGNVRANVPDPMSFHSQSDRGICRVLIIGPGCVIISRLPTVSSLTVAASMLTPIVAMCSSMLVLPAVGPDALGLDGVALDVDPDALGLDAVLLDVIALDDDAAPDAAGPVSAVDDGAVPDAAAVSAVDDDAVPDVAAVGVDGAVVGDPMLKCCVTTLDDAHPFSVACVESSASMLDGLLRPFGLHNVPPSSRAH